MELNKAIQLHQTQKQVAISNHTYRVVCCGRQWGKTTLAVIEMVAMAYSKQVDIAYFATTYDQARNIAWNMIKSYSESIWAKAPNESRLELFIKTQKGETSKITLRGWENVETARGLQFDFLVLDEVASMRSFEYNWEAVLEPTLAVRLGTALFISTPQGYNHFFELFERGQAENELWKSWRFTSYDNPHIPVSRLEQAKSQSLGNHFQQEYMANFTQSVGLVYEFDRLVHIKDLPNFKADYYIRGCDRGFRNPTAVPIIGVDSDDVWYQETELYMPGLTNPKLANLVKQMSKGKHFELSTMDSANIGDIFELAEMGVDFVPVKKEPGENIKSYVRYKIQKFAERLKVGKDGRAGYYVSPKCKNTIFEFENYRYPETKDEKTIQEEPMKLNDHMLDSLADLNIMHLNTYKKVEKKPWDDKIPGTFIPPAIEELSKDTDFTKERTADEWNDPV